MAAPAPGGSLVRIPWGFPPGLGVSVLVWGGRGLDLGGVESCGVGFNGAVVHALRVLEWDLVRGMLAERCETPVGEGKAMVLEPSFREEEVWTDLGRTGEALGLFEFELPSLRGIRDVREAVLVASKGGSLDGERLAAVGRALVVMRGASRWLALKEEVAPGLSVLGGLLPDLPRLTDDLERSLDGDGELRDEASPELALARGRKAKAGQRILEKIQSFTTGATRGMLSDPIYTQRNGRYVVPVKAEHKGKLRGIVHDSSASGQTVYIEPEEVVQLGNQLREAEAAERAEVARILKALSAAVGQHGQSIALGVETAGDLDLVFAKTRLGVDLDGCLPERSLVRAELRIGGGRHPLISAEAAVPLTVSLGGEVEGILITGPNTGGKTIAIKTVGLCVAMAQAGMAVPARSMRLGVFSQIWADIGDEQSLQQSLSTFSGHIKNIAGALRGMRKGALVLLDEVGAGTDPGEGAALARALLMEFQRRGAVVMASTHYGELKLFASNQRGFMNASMEFDLKSLRPTYRFLPGTPGSSHALKIAARYGVPEGVLAEAEKGFSESEQDIARMIEQLESAQRRAQKAQSEADKLSARLRRVEEEAERKIAAAEEARRRLGERAATELEELLREIRIEAAAVFEAVKRNPTQAGMDAARERLRSLQEAGSGLAREVRPEEKIERAVVPIKKGTKVRVLGLNLNGVVLEDPKGKKVSVQAGAMRMDVDMNKLVPLGMLEEKKPKRNRAVGEMRLRKAQTIQREIQIRQMRAEEAVEVLEKFLDEAVLAGADVIRIVHGKGEGVLRKVTHDLLRRSGLVKRFYEADADSGGQGATVAELV